MRKKLNRSEVAEVLRRLGEAYPDAGCSLNFRNPFEILVAVTLSAQTTDARVNQVTPELFDRYPDPEAMSRAEDEELQRIIRPIGMYKNKSKNIKALSAMLVAEYGGVVPGEQKELERLPGVGRKTANVVLAEAFGCQRIAVDTHVFRVANRIGLVDEKDVTGTENALMKVLPEDRWTESHHRIIHHGRQICHARKPDCDNCPLDGVCLKKYLK